MDTDNYCSYCGKKVDVKVRGCKYFCDECKANAEQVGKGKKYKICTSCGKLMRTSSGTKWCNSCFKKIFTRTCENCGESFLFTDLKHIGKICHFLCSSCKKSIKTTNPDGRMIVKCHSCGEFVSVKSQFEECPLCSRPTHPKTVTCSVCGKKFTSTHYECDAFKFICPECKEASSYSKAVKEYIKLVDSGWRRQGDLLITNIPEEKTGTEICIDCGRRFHKNSYGHKRCGYCRHVKKCPVCGNNFISQDRRVYICSQSCAVKNNHIKGIYANHIKEIINNSKRDNESNSENGNSRWSDVTSNVNVNELQAITQKNYLEFDYPGVWCKVNAETGKILDLMATASIAREWSRVQWRMKYADNYKYQTLRKIESDGKKIEYRLIKECESYPDALELEAVVAKEVVPPLWSPAPGQNVKVKD